MYHVEYEGCIMLSISIKKMMQARIRKAVTVTHHGYKTSQFTDSERGWLLRLQAPQGPYINALDLTMFPGMSKRLSETLQNLSNTAILQQLKKSYGKLQTKYGVVLAHLMSLGPLSRPTE
jgi:hypothetical protein